MAAITEMTGKFFVIASPTRVCKWASRLSRSRSVAL